MSTTLEERPNGIPDFTESDAVNDIDAPRNPYSTFQEVKEKTAEFIIQALDGRMTDSEKLDLGMEMGALEGIIRRRAEQSLESATIPNDGITEGQSEESTVDAVLGTIAEVVADVYAEQSGTISGRALEFFRRSKAHHKAGRLALGAFGGVSAMAITVIGAPIAAPAVLLGTGLRAATGKLREGLDRKINELPVEQVRSINHQLDVFTGTDEEKAAYRCLLVANMLLEPLKAELIESSHITHLDPESGTQQANHRDLAGEMAHMSTDYCLDLFGLSEVRKFSKTE